MLVREAELFWFPLSPVWPFICNPILRQRVHGCLVRYSCTLYSVSAAAPGVFFGPICMFLIMKYILIYLKYIFSLQFQTKWINPTIKCVLWTFQSSVDWSLLENSYLPSPKPGESHPIFKSHTKPFHANHFFVSETMSGYCFGFCSQCLCTLGHVQPLRCAEDFQI